MTNVDQGGSSDVVCYAFEGELECVAEEAQVVSVPYPVLSRL